MASVACPLIERVNEVVHRSGAAEILKSAPHPSRSDALLQSDPERHVFERPVEGAPSSKPAGEGREEKLGFLLCAEEQLGLDVPTQHVEKLLGSMHPLDERGFGAVHDLLT
jgi:hypothetical protein